MPNLECLLLTAAIAAAPGSAEALGAFEAPDPHTCGSPALMIQDTLFDLGRFHGFGDARDASTRGDFLRGFGWGLLAGPVGGIVAVRRASSATLPFPEGRRNAFLELGAEYRNGYHEGFGSLYPPRRREATVAGAMVGTLGFAFILLQVTDLPSRSRFRGELPDGPPTFVLVSIPLGP